MASSCACSEAIQGAIGHSIELLFRAAAATGKQGRAWRLLAPLMLALQRRLRVRVVLGALARAVSAKSALMRAQKVVELSSHQPVQLAGPEGGLGEAGP